MSRRHWRETGNTEQSVVRPLVITSLVGHRPTPAAFLWAQWQAQNCNSVARIVHSGNNVARLVWSCNHLCHDCQTPHPQRPLIDFLFKSSILQLYLFWKIILFLFLMPLLVFLKKRGIFTRIKKNKKKNRPSIFSAEVRKKIHKIKSVQS